MSTGLMAASLLLNAVSSGYQISQQEEANEKQKKALKEAEAKQAEADTAAETQRLEALAKNQESTGFEYGVDSALAARYADAAQKWGAGTGSIKEEEVTDNPFYTKGLL